MSRAGAFANEGYHYQTLIATHWLIHLLREPAEIHAIQAESMGLPGETASIRVDDIVVCYRDGRHQFIQAKKNQTDHRAWSLSELCSELLKAREQLEHWPDAIVEFYSRTPFGDLHKIAEECARYADYPAFARAAPPNQQALLRDFAGVIERTKQQAFDLAGILTAFQQASAIGRAWPRTINDQVIPTPHMESILNLVAEGYRTVLVQGGPGSGKTCVLLDLADATEESRPEWALLFIKADWFQEAWTGLPTFTSLAAVYSHLSLPRCCWASPMRASSN